MTEFGLGFICKIETTQISKKQYRIKTFSKKTSLPKFSLSIFGETVLQ